MDENAFLHSIDCCFPYTNEQQAIELIRVGCALSAEAAFAVVHELSYPGADADAPLELRQAYLDRVDRQLDHPAKEVVLPIARRIVAGEVVSVDEAVAAMSRLDTLCSVRSALHVIYFSCDDAAGVAEAAYKRIDARWREAG